jgi:CRISPR/Cas system endoribonuclease Cas6 (RAMP superfamily)
MRQIEATLRPTERFAVPDSDGYQVYSALLNALDSVDSAVSERVHDAPLGSLHSSGLLGAFAGSDRRHHKTVHPDETYRLGLGVVDPDDESVFQALVNALVLEGDTIGLAEGDLHVESFESSNTTHQELLDHAAEEGTAETAIEMEFVTPTCIEEAGEVTTMFPTRTAVFTSLLGKWNQTAPDDLEIDVDRATLAGSVIEKPDPHSYDTHSVLTNRVGDGDDTRPIFRQGFTGECTYAFKNASASTRTAVTALSLFGAYSGVGSAVARGCGHVEVTAT